MDATIAIKMLIVTPKKPCPPKSNNPATYHDTRRPEWQNSEQIGTVKKKTVSKSSSIIIITKITLINITIIPTIIAIIKINNNNITIFIIFLIINNDTNSIIIRWVCWRSTKESLLKNAGNQGWVFFLDKNDWLKLSQSEFIIILAAIKTIINQCFFPSSEMSRWRKSLSKAHAWDLVKTDWMLDKIYSIISFGNL